MTLLVDLDGTLYRQRLVQAMMASELLLGHWSRISVLRAFRHEHERLRGESIVHEQSPYQVQLEQAAAILNRPLQEIESIVSEWMFQRPGKWIRMFRRKPLLRCIAALRRKGAATALVSDYPATRKLAAMGISDLFDVVVANGETPELRRLKPCPDAFLLAAKHLNAQHENCIVVGDRKDADGEAAHRAGMRFVLV